MAKPSILFVSATQRFKRPYFDPSTRYRAFNMAQKLSEMGYRCQVAAQDVFEANLDSLSKFDVYFFHRPQLNVQIADFLVSRAGARNMIADFDDFMFDVRHTSQTPAARVRGENPVAIRRMMSMTAEAARQFSYFSVSTSPLAEHVRRLFKPNVVSILHNCPSDGYIGLCSALRRAWGRRQRPYDFGYFSGTKTHDADLNMIAPALADAMAVKPTAKLLLVGPVAVPLGLAEFNSRIHVVPLVSFYDLPALKAQCDIVLAPLEETVFTHSKSGLKFFEAALVGCRVIATPIPDIDRFDSPLLRKSVSLDEWTEALIDFPNEEIDIDSAIDLLIQETHLRAQAEKLIAELL